MAVTNETFQDTSFIYEEMIIFEMNERTMVKVAVAILMAVFFIYINCVMVFAMSSRMTFMEIPRYILFTHLLLNDSMQLLVSCLMYAFALVYLRLVKVVCGLFVMFGSGMSRVAPLNLALMSLERYAAICLPLRHSDIATPKRSGIAIAVIWLVIFINLIIDMLYSTAKDPGFFVTPIFCTRQKLFIALWQMQVFQGFNAFCFVAVSLIIIYTYIAIIVTARSASFSDKTKASKAHKTVLLHLVQLGLSLSSFLYAPIESALASVSSTTIFIDLRYFNFLFLIILPRCLSPLIYGLRDDAVRPLFLHYLTCRTRKVKAAVMVQ
ncbi:odorant receptor 131-2-like [Salvelinus alpinus]|uniref:odorant receptor 131-2-like n=1 Tax=Salvelinus alpinus TaxID=8036 RepID=UPI0039FBBD97